MEGLLEYVRQTRQTLHRIPELGFDLPRTSRWIHDELIRLGYEPIPAARSGWIALLPGKSAQAVAFRADMDALAVAEGTDRGFPSLHPGRMHACGHDGHMALLLGFARVLKEGPVPESTVVLIFQPAEEGPGGARLIVESGILQELQVRRIYGIHLYPGLTEGKFGLARGPFMARNGEFDIQLTGQGAHAGQPHQGIDALAAGAALVSQIHLIPSRSLDPLSPAVLNIGTFQAGEVRNAVAKEAALTGTIRAFDRLTYERIKQELEAKTQGIAHSFGVKADLAIRDFYPEVRNDAALVDELIGLLAPPDYEMLQPLMLAEDFSFYQQEFPGVFLFLGTGSPEKGFTHPLHSPLFDFDEAVLLRGIELYRRILGLIPEG